LRVAWRVKSQRVVSISSCYSLPLSCRSKLIPEPQQVHATSQPAGFVLPEGSRLSSLRVWRGAGIMATRPAPRCHFTPPDRSLTGGRPGRSDDDVLALQDPRNEALRP